VRREPFRLFFPLASILAGVGVMPWILFGAGQSSAWPGVPHALVMVQGFFLAAVVGFLGTMIPRRTGGAPLAWAEIGGLVAGLVGGAAAALAGSVAGAEVCVLAALAVLLRWLVACLRRRFGSPEPSFVLLPGALAALAAGAAILLVDGPWSRLGRLLIEQGFLLGIVLATAPVLAPRILGAPVRARGRAFHVAVGVLVLASFAVEAGGAERAGLLLRAATVATALAAAGAWSRGRARGLHRGLFRAALALMPAGLACAGLAPDRRVTLLHATFGGLALLVVAVSAHVTLYHTGRERLSFGWPRLLLAATSLAVVAIGLRLSLDRLGGAYVVGLAAAGALWLAAVLAWTFFLLPTRLRAP
jgi:uncharacterized protein involved in response to NO